MTNTEKPTTTAETKKQGIEKTPPKIKMKEFPKVEVSPDKKQTQEAPDVTPKIKEDPKEKKEDTQKLKVEVKKINIKKKTENIVNGRDLPVSTKQSMAICRFIKGKKIGDAIRDLEQVVIIRKPVPMKGEIPHRKGKMGSGRFPQKAAKSFITLLKSLASNSSDMEEPRISEAIANFGSRPHGRFGRIKRKRTHVKIISKEKKIVKLNKKDKINGKK